jgi:hypothetical protein
LVVSSKYHYKGPVEVNCKSISGSKDLVVYDVILKVEFDLPMIGSLPAFNVKAETKSMHNTCNSGL